MIRLSMSSRCCIRLAVALPVSTSSLSCPAALTNARMIRSSQSAAPALPISLLHSNSFGSPSFLPSLRSFHTSSSARMAAPLINPTGPTAATFDAPLPSLAPVAHIDPNELQISDNCQRRLLTLSRKHNKPVHLRVLVDQGGCSGLEYKFTTEVDGKENEEDIVIALGSTGNSVFVDRDSWLWLRGARIEYVEELARAAFVVAENPNATQACGCKSSFAPKLDSQGVPVAQANAQ